MLAAVDDWALYEPDEKLQLRLLEVARRVDPGDWLDRLRDPAVRKDAAGLAKLAEEVDVVRTRPGAIVVLTELMERRRLDAAELYAAARARHPSDFELAFCNGKWHSDRKTGQQMGPYEAARALRPDNLAVWINLGNVLFDTKDLAGAVAAFKRAIELDPNSATGHYNLGGVLAIQKDYPGAVVACRRAIELDPTDAQAHYNLGNTLRAQKDYPGAVTAYRRAIELDPKFATAHNNLGLALRSQNDVPGAVAAYRRAIELDPNYAHAHCNLGLLLVRLKQFAEALPLLKRGHELGSKQPGWEYPSAKWVADCEKDLAAQQERTAPPPRPVKR